jgi:hypothetical protein
MELNMNIKRALLAATAALMAPGLAMAQVTISFDTEVFYPDVIPDSTELNARLECNTGTPLIQNFPISEDVPVIFKVEAFQSFDGVLCTLSLTSSPAGYVLVATANTHELNDEACVYTFADDLNDSVAVVEGENFCAFTWEQQGFEYTVEKEWDYDETEAGELFEVASFEWECANVFPYDPANGAGYPSTYSDSFLLEGDKDYTVSGFWADPEGGSYCVAEELIWFDSAVESDNGCADKTFFSVGDGERTCTVTNTVFYEGIPTLSQYGLAIMALLMLGVGFVGFRRFV